MKRLFAILLIPFFVVGNSLAHSHGGAAHASQGQTRAHIHVFGASHHHHDNHDSHGHSHHSHHHDHDQDGNGCDPTPVEPGDHDSDAVFLAGADCLFTPSKRCSVDLEFQFFNMDATGIILVASGPPHCSSPPPPDISELPLYLRQAALRL
jgi:hypothetical protein